MWRSFWTLLSQKIRALHIGLNFRTEFSQKIPHTVKRVLGFLESVFPKILQTLYKGYYADMTLERYHQQYKQQLAQLYSKLGPAGEEPVQWWCMMPHLGKGLFCMLICSTHPTEMYNVWTAGLMELFVQLDLQKCMKGPVGRCVVDQLFH
jgi:hypothetical protein